LRTRLTGRVLLLALAQGISMLTAWSPMAITVTGGLSGWLCTPLQMHRFGRKTGRDKAGAGSKKAEANEKLAILAVRAGAVVRLPSGPGAGGQGASARRTRQWP